MTLTAALLRWHAARTKRSNAKANAKHARTSAATRKAP